MDNKLRLLYVHADADKYLQAELDTHLVCVLSKLEIESKSAGDLLAGSIHKDALKEAVVNADVIVLLLSSDLFKSPAWTEQEESIKKAHDQRSLLLVPVLARAVELASHPWLSKVVPVPDAPVAKAHRAHQRDAAWLAVVEHIKRLLAPPDPALSPSRLSAESGTPPRDRATPLEAGGAQGMNRDGQQSRLGHRWVVLLVALLSLAGVLLTHSNEPHGPTSAPPLDLAFVSQAVDATVPPAPPPPRPKPGPPSYCKAVREVLDFQQQQPSSTWPPEKLDSLSRKTGLSIERLRANCPR